MNYLSEGVLNVLNGNIRQRACNTRKLQKHKTAIRMVADRYMSFSGKKRKKGFFGSIERSSTYYR